MATISDLRGAIAQVIGTTLYPAGGTGNSPIAGCPVRVYQGWPEREALDADIAAGIVNVSVFVRPGGKNTTRYPVQDVVISIPAPTLGWSIVGQAATVTGTVSSPQNIGLILLNQAFIYAVQSNDTLSTIAAALAALVNAVTPASASGPTITIPAAGAIQGRTGGVGVSLKEVGREKVTLSIDIWAPSEALRNAVGAPIEPMLRDLRRITLADQSIAVTWYGQTVDSDSQEKAAIYRRMIWLEAEYASTITGAPAEVITFAQQITPNADLTGLPALGPAISQDS